MLTIRSIHPRPGEAERKERLLALIDGFTSRRVLVVGDIIADEFIYGEVARMSRAARGMRPTTWPRSGAARCSRESSEPTRKAGGCCPAFTAASSGPPSCRH